VHRVQKVASDALGSTASAQAFEEAPRRVGDKYGWAAGVSAPSGLDCARAEQRETRAAFEAVERREHPTRWLVAADVPLELAIRALDEAGDQIPVCSYIKSDKRTVGVLTQGPTLT
jgi:hypothetical protein